MLRSTVADSTTRASKNKDSLQRTTTGTRRMSSWSITPCWIGRPAGCPSTQIVAIHSVVETGSYHLVNWKR